MRFRIVASLCLFLGLAGGAATAQEPFRIGVMNDQSGPYSDIAGPGSVVAARMAIADFGGKVLGRPIELLVADHQNKPDIGLNIAREWYATKNVNAIFDIVNSAIAIGVQSLAKEQKKAVIFVATSSSDLTTKACSPYGIQWTNDNWSNAVALMRVLLAQNKKTFFFITADYTFGHSVEADATKAIKEGGGQVVGSVRAPLGTADFSSFLLAAQVSKADVVVFANAGADLSTALKQAEEFGLGESQSLAAPITYLSDVHGMGLQLAQGLTFMQSWYWDADDETRAWSKRYFEAMKRMPNDNHAGLYSAITEYLRGVEKAGSDDAAKAFAEMKSKPLSDIYAKNFQVRADGRVINDRILVQVKKPAESKGPWDYLKIVSKIDGAQAYRTLQEGGCDYVSAK